jgi:hypothetical protein
MLLKVLDVDSCDTKVNACFIEVDTPNDPIVDKNVCNQTIVFCDHTV